MKGTLPAGVHGSAPGGTVRGNLTTIIKWAAPTMPHDSQHRNAARRTALIPVNHGNVLDLAYDFHAGHGNNGNVYGLTNYKDPSRNQTFTYDSLDRLTSAQNAGTNCSAVTVNSKTEYWGNSYSYDAWGNL